MTRVAIRGAEAAAAWARTGLAGLRHEVLRVAHLDADRRVIGVRLSYGRSARGVDVPLRKIAADALALGSEGLVLAHNHPSGCARPSAEDIAVTRRLVGVAEPLGVTVHDHVIVAGAEWCSFRVLGLL